MTKRKPRTLFTAALGLLLGGIGASLASAPAPAKACSCAALVDVYELSLVSAESDDPAEVARWSATAELYSLWAAPALSLETDFLDLERTGP